MDIKAYIDDLALTLDRAGASFAHGTATALDEACYLVYGKLGLDFQQDIRLLNRELLDEEIRELDELARRRIDESIPAAYLIGEAWFAGHRFHCDPRALVPRSPMAELILNQFAGLLSEPPKSVLDLCCGGGCIGIATALQFPDCQVDLADVSPQALALAQSNTELHGLQDRVQCIQSDLFQGIEKSYQLILCNPPYVPEEEYRQLPAEFSHEPRQGLVSPDQGLAIPLQVIKEAGQYLSDEGLLIMEAGHSADALQQRLPDMPFLWLDFSEGGEGVLALRAHQLGK